jgi:hypothetical protein
MPTWKQSCQPSRPCDIGRRFEVLLVAGGLVLAALLALSSAAGDSINFDEMADLTAGVSHLLTGDYRLSPAHPPLSKMWSALPLLLTDQQWITGETPGWREGQTFQVGRVWLGELNDGERLVLLARCMSIALLLATCFCIYVMARSLFGQSAALLALALAVLSPSLLAHGRLVTTDLPLTLGAAVTLLAYARLLERFTAGRLVAASVALAATSLIKFSWVLIVPAVVVMGVVVVARPTAGESEGPESNVSHFQERNNAERPRRRLGVAAAVVSVVGAAAVVWAAIWTCYGWRYSPFRGPDREEALMMPAARVDRPLATTMAEAWDSALHTADGRPIRGPVVSAIVWARDRRLLPEAYLYGLAYTLRTTTSRPAYLHGAISDKGWLAYFPIAFAIKTPVPTLLLLLAGLAAMFRGRVPTGRSPVLLAGLGTFAVVYAAAAMASHTDIGHRHILPLYPAVFVFAGAAAGWLSWRPGRWVLAGLLVWLAAANLWAWPNYLGYFNELIGGPTRGYRWLADSNVDWGQDLKRLARYADEHPDERIKLAYFGSADATRYGHDWEMLPSYLPNRRNAAELTAGTYVISETQLLGVYYVPAREALWRAPEIQEEYRRLHDKYADSSLDVGTATEEGPAERVRFEQLRCGRLFRELRGREPDERIGTSLFVYRLSAEDVERLTAP